MQEKEYKVIVVHYLVLRFLKKSYKKIFMLMNEKNVDILD